MATKVVGRLGVDVSANTASLEAGMRKAAGIIGRAQKQWSRELKGAERAFGNITSAIGGIQAALGTMAAAGGLTLLARNAINAADSFGEAATRVGLTAEEYQKFVYAAKLSGLEIGKLEQGFNFLNKQIASGKLNYRSTSEAIQDIADRVAAAKTPIEKTNLLIQAFGARAGASFNEFLSRGSEGLRALGIEAERMGIILSNEVVDKAARLNDAFDIIGMSITRNFQAGLLEGFTDQSGELRDIFTDPAFLNGVRDIGKAIGEMVSFLVENGDTVLRITQAMAGAFVGGKVAGPVGAGAGAVGGAFGGDIVRASRGVNPITGERVTMEMLRDRINGTEGSAQFGPPMPPNQTVLPPIAAQMSAAQRGFKPAGSRGSSPIDDSQKYIDGVLDGLRRESMMLEIQVDLFGQKKSAIDRASKAAELNFEINDRGVKLTETQRKQMQELLVDIEKQKSAYEKLQEQQEKMSEAERQRQQAFQQFAFTFESAFEDAITSGKKLGDVIRSLAQDILKVAIRTQVTQPIASGIGELFGSIGGGKKGGGFLDSIFGGIGSIFGFADGGVPPIGRPSLVGERGPELIVPNTRMTVIPNEMLGGGGGNVYNIDARGADQGAVARLEQLVLTSLGPGAIERRVATAQQRGEL